jgi:hypothetical protein
MRSKLISETLQEPLLELLDRGDRAKTNALFRRAIQDERLFAIGYCNGGGRLIFRTPTFPESIKCPPSDAAKKHAYTTLILPQGPIHVSTHSIDREGKYAGSLVLVHDMSFIALRSADTRTYVIILFIVLGVVISLITVFVAHLSWRGWLEGMRAMLRGEGIVKPFARQTPPSELQPLVGDLRSLVRTLDAERRFADDATITWNPESLRRLLHKELAGERIMVVSNREPYIHVHRQGRIELQRPASGVVTAIEPVMRACSGTWIAHGGGSADRAMADGRDRVMIPPEHPEYTLRRIWLTPEEELGYYYGFANEGLWPLCHIAHVRPVFRSSDWQYYKKINQRFADAVGDPGSGAGPHDRLDGRDHAAGRPLDLDAVLPVNVDIGLAVGNDDDAFPRQLLLQQPAQRFGIPGDRGVVGEAALRIEGPHQASQVPDEGLQFRRRRLADKGLDDSLAAQHRPHAFHPAAPAQVGDQHRDQGNDHAEDDKQNDDVSAGVGAAKGDETHVVDEHERTGVLSFPFE